MKKHLFKIKFIFIPYLLISVFTIIFFALFKWLFVIKLRWLKIDSSILEFYFPGTLLAILILLFLRKRIHVLNIGDNDKWYFFYQVIALFSIGIPTVIAEKYIEAASYDLVHVKSIKEINRDKPLRYYQIDSANVSKKDAQFYSNTSTSGKYGQTLNFNLYIACPIKMDDKHSFWYAISFHNSVNNRESKDEKELDYKTFIDTSIKSFEVMHFKAPLYYDNLPYNRERTGFYKAVSKEYEVKNSDLFILSPVQDTPFNNRCDVYIKSFIISLLTGTIIFFLMTIKPAINKKDLVAYYRGKLLQDDWFGQVLVFLIPSKPHIETSILVDALILYFIYSVFCGTDILSPSNDELYTIGSVSFSEFYYGAYWRLLTSIFSHAGAIHLANNLFSLGIAGILIERFLKKGWFTILFFINGITATFVSFIWLPDVYTVGASGAIFGCYGIMASLLIRKLIPFESKVGYYFALGVMGGLSIIIGFVMPSVNNAAHIGGLLSGIFWGLIIPVKRSEIISIP